MQDSEVENMSFNQFKEILFYTNGVPDKVKDRRWVTHSERLPVGLWKTNAIVKDDRSAVNIEDIYCSSKDRFFKVHYCHKLGVIKFTRMVEYQMEGVTDVQEQILFKGRIPDPITFDMVLRLIL